MESKSADKSRRERRKEARLEKNKKKFNSWVDHQQSRKLKKHSADTKSKNVKFLKDNTCDQEDLQIELENSKNGNACTFERVLEGENSVDSMEVPVGNSGTKKVRRNETSVARSKFEEYLQMEKQGDLLCAEEDLRLEKKLAKKLKIKDGKLPGKDSCLDMLLDGIPSVLNYVEEGKTQDVDIDLKPRSRGKSQKCISSEEELEVEKKYDGMQKSTMSCSSKMELDTLNSNSNLSLGGKVKKTKFEEYLEMDLKKDAASAEEDLAVERRLAKKLKVKDGRLGGDDDDINMLFEGMSSGQDSFEQEEFPDAEKAPRKSLKNSSAHKKRKKEPSEQELDNQMASDAMVGQSEPSSSPTVVETEKVSTKAPIMEANVKYVAPHLRSHAKSDSNEHPQIRKRVRGLLNRLSESNVEAVTGEASAIIHDVGRSIGSEIISTEVLTACSGGPRGNEQYASVHAAFVAGMSCVVGIDFGAKLLSSLARAFEDEYTKEDNLSMRNLILLLSYIYTFGVCSSDLIFDFLLTLSKRLTEVDVATILTILQYYGTLKNTITTTTITDLTGCGMKLRSDDPAAMKNFIISIQNRVNELKSTSEGNEGNKSGKRMEFMLETICDIKNNKKRAKEDNVQHTKIKKWLQKLKVDEVLIRGITWNTLLDLDKKGQWWLSGDTVSGIDNIEDVSSKVDLEITETQKMLQLAAAQRMNTDARRAIFCIVMSGEDYIDTFERLLRLDLPGKQDREIMRVIIDCCLQEKIFNKYYCVLASKLCSHDKNHKFTLQYCLWDHFKEMESMQLIRSMHLSKFIAEMLASYTISLAVLKVVDFHDPAQLTPKRIMHFRMLFEAIFTYPDRLIWNMFTRIAVTPEYEALRSGIEFFIRKYVVSSQKSVAEKFKVAKKALNNNEGVLL